MTPAIALKLLDLVFLGATTLPQALARRDALVEKLRGFGDRDPTPDEWDALNAETDALMDSLDERAKQAEDPNAT